MIIDIQGVKITLTKDQLAEIAKQTEPKRKTIKELISIDIAEEVLINCKSHKRLTEQDFKRLKDWINYKLETIIKAANYIDNNYKEWKPDFNRSSGYKYIPYFEKKSSGWVLIVVIYLYSSSSSSCSVGFYYKVSETAEFITKQYESLYNEHMKG